MNYKVVGFVKAISLHNFGFFFFKKKKNTFTRRIPGEKRHYQARAEGGALGACQSSLGAHFEKAPALFQNDSIKELSNSVFTSKNSI